MEQLSGGHLELQFDTDAVTDLSFQKSEKLSEMQFAPVIDTESGVVRVTFSNQESASLTDKDILAQRRSLTSSDQSRIL
ncbi:hypothetical protein [Paenibacillus xylanilyticus]|uniref:hypothetical protein n=1 Tax=Paenibacillus xylanilyticus TaxID=248903 RepID=UPI0039A3F1AE